MCQVDYKMMVGLVLVENLKKKSLLVIEQRHLINLKRILLSINNKEISIYVHWPYCVKKCPYCDFNSHVNKSEIEIKDWEKSRKTI